MEFSEDGIAYNACEATIGFDTWWTDEDYVTKVAGCGHGYKVRGRVKNSNGTSSGWTEWKTTSRSGKADVKHTGNAVKYQFEIKE